MFHAESTYKCTSSTGEMIYKRRTVQASNKKQNSAYLLALAPEAHKTTIRERQILIRFTSSLVSPII